MSCTPFLASYKTLIFVVGLGFGLYYLNYICVVPSAAATFVVDKVVFDLRFGSAVVAQDLCLVQLKFFWHFLLFDLLIDPTINVLHILDALLADWARKSPTQFHLCETAAMDCVPTPHEHHWNGRCKEIVSADGTVRV